MSLSSFQTPGTGLDKANKRYNDVNFSMSAIWPEEECQNKLEKNKRVGQMSAAFSFCTVGIIVLLCALLFTRRVVIALLDFTRFGKETFQA